MGFFTDDDDHDQNKNVKKQYRNISQNKYISCKTDPEDPKYRICKETTEYIKDNKLTKDVKEYREKNSQNMNINLFDMMKNSMQQDSFFNSPFFNGQFPENAENEVNEIFERLPLFKIMQNRDQSDFNQNNQNNQQQDQRKKTSNFRNFSKNDNEMFDL